MVVESSFFKTSTRSLAKNLLGTFLEHSSAEGITVGRIVETEAYLFKNDPACHAHRGKTKRNAAMFGPAGLSYVYLIYGIYYCFNVVSGKKGEGEAVLVRALEPVRGIELMDKRRNTRGSKSQNIKSLCSGPGKLADALGLNLDQNELDLRTSSLRLHTRCSFPDHPRRDRFSVVRTTRVGISKGATLPLRYYIKDSEFISRP